MIRAKRKRCRRRTGVDSPSTDVWATASDQARPFVDLVAGIVPRKPGWTRCAVHLGRDLGRAFRHDHCPVLNSALSAISCIRSMSGAGRTGPPACPHLSPHPGALLRMMIARTDDIDACLSHPARGVHRRTERPRGRQDGRPDASAIHILARDASGEAWGTSAAADPGRDRQDRPRRRAERRARHRSCARLIEASIAELGKVPGVTRLKLSAQTYVIPFTNASALPPCPGLRRCGIPHRDMARDL